MVRDRGRVRLRVNVRVQGTIDGQNQNLLFRDQLFDVVLPSGRVVLRRGERDRTVIIVYRYNGNNSISIYVCDIMLYMP
jgi:hypothetical protein